MLGRSWLVSSRRKPAQACPQGCKSLWWCRSIQYFIHLKYMVLYIQIWLPWFTKCTLIEWCQSYQRSELSNETPIRLSRIIELAYIKWRWISLDVDIALMVTNQSETNRVLFLGHPQTFSQDVFWSYRLASSSSSIAGVVRIVPDCSGQAIAYSSPFWECLFVIFAAKEEQVSQSSSNRSIDYLAKYIIQ